VELYWINPTTKESVLQSDPFIYNGATFALNSFVTHHFEARELPGKSGKCASSNDACGVGYFTVNENSDQVINIDKGFKLSHVDNVSIARESAVTMIANCKEEALLKLEEDGGGAEDTVDFFSKCVENSVSAEMQDANEEIAFQANIRQKMAERWENYTCADYDMPTSESIRSESWYHKGQKRNVEILLDKPSSRVHLIQNFISEEECEAMEKSAKKSLHRATVADGKGGSELSSSRKAMQAGIKIPWKLEKDGNKLTTLSRKVYDYVNHVLDMDIKGKSTR